MRSRLLLPLALLVGCVSNPTVPRPDAKSISGVVEGLSAPARARVELYRMTAQGVAERMHGAEVVPATDGTFQTTPMLPGRYLLALRSAGRPVSTTTVAVPPAPSVRLVARQPFDAVKLELRHDLEDAEALSVLLSRVEDGVAVVDRRLLDVPAGDGVLVSGLTPGTWNLDVLGTGATTTVAIPEAGQAQTLTISPPAVGTGGVLLGRVLRVSGGSAAGVAISVHPISDSGSEAASWGRYAVTDSDGGYRLAGLTPGRALLRVTCREGVHRRLPPATEITIPPSGVLRRSFVVEP